MTHVTKTAIMITVEVYDKTTGNLLGMGWLTNCQGNISAPTLIGFDDRPLPEAWYILRPTLETLVVISDRKQ